MDILREYRWDASAISSSMELKFGRWKVLLDRLLVWIWMIRFGFEVGRMKQEQIFPLQQVWAMVVTTLLLQLLLFLVQHADADVGTDNDADTHLGADRRKMVWRFPLLKVFEIIFDFDQKAKLF